MADICCYQNEDECCGPAEVGCCHLPDDIITGILVRLPFANLVQAGTVCKRWHALVRSTKVENSTPWCLLCCPVHVDRWRVEREWLSWMFDPSECNWHSIPNPLHNVNPWTEVTLFRSTGGYSGLVGLLQVNPVGRNRCQVYWVGNPITNKWSKILAPETHKGVDTSLVVDKCSKTYKLVSINRREGSLFTWGVEVYWSATRRWQAGATYMREGSLILPLASAVSDNAVYLLAMRHVSGIEIISYNVTQDCFGVVIPIAEFVHSGVHMYAGTFQLLVDDDVSGDAPEKIQFIAGSLEPYVLDTDLLHLDVKGDQEHGAGNVHGQLLSQDTEDAYQHDKNECPGFEDSLVNPADKEVGSGKEETVGGDGQQNHFGVQARYRVSRICVAKFASGSKSWTVKSHEEMVPADARTWFRDGTNNLFRCSGVADHFYIASFDCPNVILMYEGQKRGWCRLPSWSEAAVLDASVWSTSTVGTFIPRLDVDP